jgi:protein TonB
VSGEPDKPRFNPRSPVQPGRSSAPYFIAALIAGVVIWLLQQWVVEDSDLPGLRPTAATHRQAEPQRPGEDIRRVFNGDDYPADAQRNGEQGSVRARLDVDENGKVSRCTIIQSSGYDSLDDATCNVLKARASFRPARDANGKAVRDSVVTPQIVWRLEG